MADTSGATIVEYGLLAGIISVALLGGLGTFANRMNGQFYGITNTIENAWVGQ
jgi:pilus assembly protein Flp/PilA